MEDAISFEFKKIEGHPARLSDWVKDTLKQTILGGELTPGDRLPSEEEIARELKVSKVTVREALRSMEFEGFIEKRRGMYGGSFVTAPTLDPVRDQVMNCYHSGGISPEELVEFRLILEPTLVAMAAERRTEEDLSAIRQNISRFEATIGQGRVDHRVAIEFHRLIGQACHNPLVSAVMEALVAVFIEILSQVPMSIEEARIDLDYCKAFYDCLVNGQQDRARQLMHEHFDTLSSIIKDARAKNIFFGKDPGADS